MIRPYILQRQPGCSIVWPFAGELFHQIDLKLLNPSYI